VDNTTSNNIVAVGLLVEETRVPREKHQLLNIFKHEALLSLFLSMFARKVHLPPLSHLTTVQQKN